MVKFFFFCMIGWQLYSFSILSRFLSLLELTSSLNGCVFLSPPLPQPPHPLHKHNYNVLNWTFWLSYNQRTLQFDSIANSFLSQFGHVIAISSAHHISCLGSGQPVHCHGGSAFLLTPCGSWIGMLWLHLSLEFAVLPYIRP